MPHGYMALLGSGLVCKCCKACGNGVSLKNVKLHQCNRDEEHDEEEVPQAGLSDLGFRVQEVGSGFRI